MLALLFFCCCWSLPKVKFLDKMYSSENQFLRKVFLDFKGPLSILVCQKPACVACERHERSVGKGAVKQCGWLLMSRRNGENCSLAAKNLTGAEAVPHGYISKYRPFFEI